MNLQLHNSTTWPDSRLRVLAEFAFKEVYSHVEIRVQYPRDKTEQLIQARMVVFTGRYLIEVEPHVYLTNPELYPWLRLTQKTWPNAQLNYWEEVVLWAMGHEAGHILLHERQGLYPSRSRAQDWLCELLALDCLRQWREQQLQEIRDGVRGAFSRRDQPDQEQPTLTIP